LGANFTNFQVHLKKGQKIWENWGFFGNLKGEIGVFDVGSQVFGGGNPTLSTMRLFI
jgi:hypothetical protein